LFILAFSQAQASVAAAGAVAGAVVGTVVGAVAGAIASAGAVAGAVAGVAVVFLAAGESTFYKFLVFVALGLAVPSFDT